MMISYKLAVENFIHRDAAKLGYHIRILHLEKGVDSGLDDAVGVGRALALGEHVFDAYALKDSTHSTTSDNAGTRGSGFEEHASAAVLAGLLVGDSALEHGDLDEVFLGIVGAFLDSGLDFLCLAEAVAYNTIFVSNNDDGSEGESATTLGNLGGAVDSHEAIFEFGIACNFNSIISCHD